MGALQQGGVVARTQLPPPMPSSAELTNLQLQHALSLANLQAAGYDVTRGPNGEMTLTPRTTPGNVMESQLGAAGPGLQRELANLGPQTSQLGNQLNTQAFAGARGQPQVNRNALIQAIQQKRGSATGLGLQAQGPTSIMAGPLSSATSFGNIPSLSSLSGQRTGANPFLTQQLPAALGIAGASLPLLSRLFGGLSGGSSPGGVPFPSANLPVPSSFEQNQFENVFPQEFGSQGQDWIWVDDSISPDSINFGLT